MLKNIWYCIKKTSEWYFALLVLYIILTLVNATIPILSAFLPKLVIEKLTLGSDIKGLIGTIMVFMGSIAVLTAVYDAQRSPFCFRTAVFRSQRPPIFS